MGEMAVPLARAATTLNEADLIRRAQKGDGDAFASLVEAYDNNVLRIAYNLLRNEEEARDIYQEAFLRVFKNLDNFRFDCAFHTWLYRIVTNLCLDHLRRRKVRKEDYSAQRIDSATTNAVERVEEHRASSDPQRHLISKQLGERIRQALESLSPRERMVFELRHYQGMRLRGIGETLGTTEEAAKNCLFRATQKMRAALGDFV